MGVHLEKALLLFEQSRYDMATNELHSELAECPYEARAHALLGLCLSMQQKYEKATESARSAIALSPDLPFTHYVMGYIACDRNQFDEAQKSLQEAIRLNPVEASYFALLSRCKYNQKLWQDALDTASKGLSLEPENVECLNYRALALSQLGQKEEAIAMAENAISQSPQDAAAYATSGWILLNHGQNPQKALEYFREALRLNPNFEWARQGIIEALKAKNLVYRLMLRYFAWSSRLNTRNRWIFIIGLYVVIRLLLGTFVSAGLTTFAGILAGIYVLFIYFSWIADPLFTLLLRLNKFGRLALSGREIQQSNWWGACLAIAVISLFLLLFTKTVSVLVTAFVFSLLLVPLAAVFYCREGWTRKTMTVYTIFLGIIGVSSIFISFIHQSILLVPMAAFLIGAIASSWLASYLIGITPTK
ncbi:MAG: tetratricopeptide repeat protein [Cyanobacteria bacterium P01_A01_bin.45]